MASTQKFTHDAMSDQNRHIDREHDTPRNKDIDRTKSYLNYAFPMAYKNQKPFQYYKQRIGAVYMYGRGTKREKKAVTGCGWIVTLPKELYGDPAKEKAFFSGVYDFISDRYGKENIINNAVHYDESGLPHIHVIFIPVTTLDHDIVRYKTKNTKTGIQLSSGRWEYKYIHVDKNGCPAVQNDPSTWTKLNNYARMSDYFDYKVDCNTVLNTIELRHFHSDLQKYLSDHGIDGKVITGKTGTSFSVKELKDFTQKTGLHLEDVKELQTEPSLLESLVKSADKIATYERDLETKNQTIKDLSTLLSQKDFELYRASEQTIKLKEKIAELEQELTIAKEWDTSQQIKEQSWGSQSSSWGSKHITTEIEVSE